MRLITKIYRLTAVFLLVCMTCAALTVSASNANSPVEIDHWEMRLEKKGESQASVLPSAIQGDGEWNKVKSIQGTQPLPSGVSGAWTRVALPEWEYKSPSVYIHTLYAMHVKVYVEDQLVYEDQRSYIKDNYSLLVPLSAADHGKALYLWTDTLKDRIGIKDRLVIGEHNLLVKEYTKNGLIDVILGGSFIFVALVLMVCAVYLNKLYFRISACLSVVIAATGVLSLTYSPFIYIFYDEWGAVSIFMLDIALFSLLPALTFLFEEIFGSGKYHIIRRYRKFQVIYSLFCMLCLIINTVSGNRFVELYYFLSTTIVGLVMIVQFLLLIVCVVVYSARGNKDAIIFAVGFGTAALTGLAELVWYYIRKGNYDLFYWKWALVVFILSLIIILGRRLALNHRQVVQYSMELELFNNELQRSEKMEIISELAASVAHEVRNPLQVTRGFLQLISEKTANEEKEYISMALSELDRASNIITDFLTFAKPEFEQISLLNVCEEFKHIESILLPLCHLNDGKMMLEVADGLWLKGNSSKFKQAFINIIKNSIESLQGEGLIQISAYGRGDKIFIHIKDNGEGMDADVLSRLGEPYFSNKTKGTGLGLMVTFRIIEAMGGDIRFLSEKGVGTESITVLPLAEDSETSHSLV